MRRGSRSGARPGEVDRALTELRQAAPFTPVTGKPSRRRFADRIPGVGSPGDSALDWHMFLSYLRPVAMGFLSVAFVASLVAAVVMRPGSDTASQTDAGLSLIADGGPESSDAEGQGDAGGDEPIGTTVPEAAGNGPAPVTDPGDTDDGSASATFGRSTGTSVSSTSLLPTTTTTAPPATTAVPATTVAPTEQPTTVAPPSTEQPTPTEAPTTTVDPNATTTISPTTVPLAPDWVVFQHYDFGPVGSPLKPGSIAIGPGQTGPINFSGGALSAVDRNYEPLMRRDLVYSGGSRSFNHAIGNGTYLVTITMGDAGHAHDEMAVTSEGAVLASGVSTAAGEFKVIKAVVPVADGELKITFSDQGGTNPHWVLNGITIHIDKNNPPEGLGQG